jgi:hypothetical protein
MGLRWSRKKGERRAETGERRRETGGRRQETGGGRREMGDGRTGDRRTEEEAEGKGHGAEGMEQRVKD